MASVDVKGLEIHAPVSGRMEEVLTPDALEFVAGLHREFESTRQELLQHRAERRAELDAGGSLDFLDTTREIREDDSWVVAAPPDDLRDRRVEITGPTQRKMVINALNSGARGFMADFEDSNSPTWQEHDRGPRESHGRDRAHDRVHAGRRQGVPAERRGGHVARAPRAAGTCRRST